MGKLITKLPPARWSLKHAAHLLRRASFGGSPEEVDMCYHLGLETSVDLLLMGIQPGAKNPGSRARLHPKQEKIPYEYQSRSSEMEAADTAHLQRLFSLQSAWLGRMLGVSAPREKMALFWHGMLTSAYGKVRVAPYMIRQNQLFRSMAFGDYRELIKRVVIDPAMIIYLDIDKNKRTKPNENFARELLELFTLGEGNYAPQEIKKLAKQIVGFRLKPVKDTLEFKDGGMRGMEANSGFADLQRRLGRVVDGVFSHKKMGVLLSQRLWKFYANVTLDHAVVEEMAQLLKKSRWKVEPVLRALWMSEVFFSEAVMAQQIKSPVQYLVQGHREVGATRLDAGCVYLAMNKLGQQLFNPPNVAGWPAGTSWITGDSLSARYQLSLKMAGFMERIPAPVSEYFYQRFKQDRIAGLVKMMDHFLPVELPVAKAKVLLDISKSVTTRQQVGGLISYMMCMPEYQIC